MSLTEMAVFAQLDPENMEVSTAQAVSVLLVLMVMGGSLAINISWIRRWRQGRSLLPAADLGLLRVPAVLLVAALFVSSLIVAMVLANTMVPADGLPANIDMAEGQETAEAEVETEAGAEADTVPEPGDANETGDLRLLQSQLLQTLIFDLALLGVFGLVVLSVSLQGRAAVPTVDAESLPVAAKPLIQIPMNPEFFTDEMAAEPAAVDETPAAGGYCLWRECLIAGEVFLAAYLPTAASKLVLMLLVRMISGKEAQPHPFLEMMGQGVDWFILLQIVLMAAVLAPVVEELFYRVVILGGLVQLGKAKAGLVISSIVFCLAHGFPDSLALIPLAFALGYTYIQRRSYVTVILVHFLFNAFNLLVAGLAMPV